MLRTATKLVSLALLVIAGGFGIAFYHDHSSANKQIEKLQTQKRQLQQIVTRLSDERRVADVLVTNRAKTPAGIESTLMFEEYARDGSTLPPKQFTIMGDEVHIDAMVIKFDHGFVEHDDALRGHSIALFTKLYGADQTPSHGFAIDPPGRVPDYYRGTDPVISTFEQDLWKNFWRLADDPSYAKAHGVRVANGQGVWGPFKPNRLYTITIEANGGLNLSSAPVKGIYRELLKRNGAI